MSLSLNEVEAMANKAARGAGYDWGLAEEAAMATRWLCAHGIDGVAALADWLDQIDGGARAAPLDPSVPVWQADTILCPLATGAALSDFASLWTQADLRLSQAACPTLLLPFVAAAARQTKRILTLSTQTAQATTDGRDLSLTGPFAAHSTEITLTTGEALDAPRSETNRATPPPQAWDTLTRLAHRTYAPATEASRLAGAGAGLSDND